MASLSERSSSPFHQGEIDVQRRVGVADRVSDRGKASIRTWMPDQHHAFFAGLECHRDHAGALARVFRRCRHRW